MKNRKVNDIGIVGFGSFGKFLAKLLTVWFGVIVCDEVDWSSEARSLGIVWGTLDQVLASDVVILAVPLGSLEGLLQKRVWGNLDSRTLVVNVCSTQRDSLRLLGQYLPTADVIGIHPMFGPESAKDRLWGHKIALCTPLVRSPKLEYLLELCRRAGLRIIETTPQEHDRKMAKVQGLTHFIARALLGCGIEELELSTTAFEHLVELVKLLSQDSWELFCTIQNGNPFAAEMRQQFMEELQNLERRLKE